jgi:hypothetical protein
MDILGIVIGLVLMAIGLIMVFVSNHCAGKKFIFWYIGTLLLGAIGSACFFTGIQLLK